MNLINAIAGGGAAGLVLAQISTQTPVPLGQAIGAFVFIGGIIWWSGRKFQSLETEQKRQGKLLDLIFKKMGIPLDDDEPTTL